LPFATAGAASWTCFRKAGVVFSSLFSLFFPLSAVKKRSRALPLSPWLGHEKEGEWVGQMHGQEQGKKVHDGTK
jgi:hypothetical protein